MSTKLKKAQAKTASKSSPKTTQKSKPAAEAQSKQKVASKTAKSSKSISKGDDDEEDDEIALPADDQDEDFDGADDLTEEAEQALAEKKAEAEDFDEDEVAEGGKAEDGNEAALAAATSANEMSASFKNFRHHPDMENFYRFIYENDLRIEALQIMDELIQSKKKIKPTAPTKNK